MDQLDMSSYNDYHRRYYQEHRADIIRENRELRELRTKLRMCRYCGKQDAYTLIGRSRCAECVGRETERRRMKMGYSPRPAPQDRPEKPWVNRPRGANGYCWQCNKRPSMDGRRLCRECYEVKVSNIRIVNGRRNGRMYNVYRMEQGQPDTLIGVAETPGEAAETIENDKLWLGRDADYRWQYEEQNQEDE